MPSSPDERRFCVFSLAASTDGTEVLGGWVQVDQHWTCVWGWIDLCFTKDETPVFNIRPDYLIFASRANDGCLYVYDLEQNKRTLKVSLSGCVFALTCTCFWVLSTSWASSCDQGEENFSRPESFWGQLHPTVGRACWTVLPPPTTTPSCVNQ